MHPLLYKFFATFGTVIIRVWLSLYRMVMGSFPSCRAASERACTMSQYIGASRRLIGTHAPIYRCVACNELKRNINYLYRIYVYSDTRNKQRLHHFLH